ncbi:ubiquitin-conjugating enzyme-like protein, partial [Euroglyphus maynei]
MDASLSTYGITHSGCPIFLQIKMLNDENGGEYHLNQTSTLATTSDCKLVRADERTETNGHLYEKDDDSIFESLRPNEELPPYSREEISDNKIHVRLMNDEKSALNYIQNPLASLDFATMNSVSSRTSFNETIDTTSNDQNFQTNSTKSFFYQEADVPSYKNELIFESLNFVNEMLPRVEEENEEELEEYDDDNEIGEILDNQNDENDQQQQ